MREQTEMPERRPRRQRELMNQIREISNAGGRTPLAFVDTYGCQQNEADSERLRGMLREMGYDFTRSEGAADIIVINTCAVREHAEMRVLGNVGALTHTKRANPNQIIALCGCMMQQEHMAERIKKSFRHVDLVFGPHALWQFPEFIHRLLTEKGRIFELGGEEKAVIEGLPQEREGKVRAWLSVMYGCNNFCSYCIVPYVRGRERSREHSVILREAKELVEAGYRDITLLGQNVNSYGRDLGPDMDFSSLLEAINDIEGEFLIRFMTSHPKDATERLFQVMARCDKVAGHIHLPVQAGNNRILRGMNRGYTKEEYLELISLAREYMPEIVLTSDIIVGFPSETDEEFEDTLDVIERVRFDALFTFIYSKRKGTPAADMPDNATREEKQLRFDRLLEAQNRISAEKHRAYVGSVQKVLVDGPGQDERYNLAGRTNGGRLVRLEGAPALIGKFVPVRITGAGTWSLTGETMQQRS